MAGILLLPLDDRPCNRLFPARLARIAGLTLISPPRELLGSFTTPGQPEALIEWMLGKARAAQAAIVSIDMLCYGGLIASRTPEVPLELACRRLESLRALKKSFPHLPLYAASVIMRLSITADSPERLPYWRDIALFSQLDYRISKLGQKRWQEALAAIQRRIPAELLDSYLRARERNHAVNREVVKLVADGILESAILCQEDAAPIGPHLPEQQALIARAKELSIPQKVFLYAGADEASLLLLAKAACGARQPRIAVCYGSREGAERVALYEDRPIEENLASQINASGGVMTRRPEEADLVLLVHTPTGPQRESLRLDEETERRSRPQARRLAQRATALLGAGARVAFADLAYNNGADPALVKALGAAQILPLLAGYAGWNTAANSLGTALAQGVLSGMEKESPPSGRRQRTDLDFLFERLVDDFLYQSLVRQEANEWAESLGLSPLFLDRAKSEVEGFVRKRLGKLAKEFFQAHFQDRLVANGFRIARLRRLEIRLPWPRTFEVEVTARIEIEACD